MGASNFKLLTMIGSESTIVSAGSSFVPTTMYSVYDYLLSKSNFSSIAEDFLDSGKNYYVYERVEVDPTDTEVYENYTPGGPDKYFVKGYDILMSNYQAYLNDRGFIRNIEIVNYENP